MSRHGSQAAGNCLVAALYFHVTTVLVSLSRQRFPCRDRDGDDKLHPSCCNMFGLGRDFSVATGYYCVMAEFGQGQKFLCRDKVFQCYDRVCP